MNNDDNNEYIERSIGDVMIDNDYIREPNEDETNSVQAYFSDEQQDYCSYNVHNITKDETSFEHLDFTDEAQTLYVINSEFKKRDGQGDVKSCLNEEQNISAVQFYCVKKDEECVVIKNEDERTDANEETIDYRNELNCNVKSTYCDGATVKDYLNYNGIRYEAKNQLNLVNTRAFYEEQTNYDNHSGHNEGSSKSIKCIVITKELKKDEKVILHKIKPSTNLVEISLFSKETTDPSKIKPNYTKEENTKHQTSQTCDIMFIDKEKSMAGTLIYQILDYLIIQQKQTVLLT